MVAAHLQEADAERILVLDDDPEICELTQAYLQQQGLSWIRFSLAKPGRLP